jgi:hypothetical protein
VLARIDTHKDSLAVAFTKPGGRPVVVTELPNPESGFNRFEDLPTCRVEEVEVLPATPYTEQSGQGSPFEAGSTTRAAEGLPPNCARSACRPPLRAQQPTQ